MTLICLIGSSYSGKSYFLEKLSKICDFTRISLGDIFRAKGEKGICVTPEDLKLEVRKALAKANRRFGRHHLYLLFFRQRLFAAAWNVQDPRAA